MIYLCLITLLFGVASCQVSLEDNNGTFTQPPFEAYFPTRPRLRNAYTAIKWPSPNNIPYLIDNRFSAVYKANIMASLREIEKSTSGSNGNCVTFRPKTAGDAEYMHFQQRQDKGCYSPIGRQSGQFINDVVLADYCHQKSTVMHEILHSLGFYHEMARPDRDRYVTIDKSNLKWTEAYFIWGGQLAKYLDTLGTQFDLSSIMLYGAYGGTYDSGRPVMKSKTIVNRMGTLLVKHLSRTDVLRVQKLYGCQVTDRNRVKLEGIKFESTFEDNRLNGLSQARDDDIDWNVRKSGSSNNPGTGPVADHSNGRGTYAYIDARRNHNKVARLEARSIERGEYCLFFAIFIYGRDGGQFNVKYTEDGRTTPNGEKTYYTTTHYSNKRWQYKHLDINMSRAWKLVLEYQVGRGDSSDAGLDDILLIKGRCKDNQ